VEADTKGATNGAAHPGAPVTSPTKGAALPAGGAAGLGAEAWPGLGQAVGGSSAAG